MIHVILNENVYHYPSTATLDARAPLAPLSTLAASERISFVFQTWIVLTFLWELTMTYRPRYLQ